MDSSVGFDERGALSGGVGEDMIGETTIVVDGSDAVAAAAADAADALDPVRSDDRRSRLRRRSCVGFIMTCIIRFVVGPLLVVVGLAKCVVHHAPSSSAMGRWI